MFTVFTQNMMPPGVELVNFNDKFLCQTGSVISLVTVFEHWPRESSVATVQFMHIQCNYHITNCFCYLITCMKIIIGNQNISLWRLTKIAMFCDTFSLSFKKRFSSCELAYFQSHIFSSILPVGLCYILRKNFLDHLSHLGDLLQMVFVLRCALSAVR